jgi:hypothetical protein
MSANKENANIVGVGVAACAMCCAGPILGVLAAIGLGTAAGFLLIGAVALLIGASAIAAVLVRRRHRANRCGPVEGHARARAELGESVDQHGRPVPLAWPSTRR